MKYLWGVCGSSATRFHKPTAVIFAGFAHRGKAHHGTSVAGRLASAVSPRHLGKLSAVAAVSGERQTDLAIERLMTESRPELFFLEDAGGDRTTGARSDFTIHIVNGSGEGLSPEDVDAVASADLLVLNKTHLGPPLDVQRHVSVRESLQIRGAAPCVFAQLRHGIGAIEIVKPFLARWRQASRAGRVGAGGGSTCRADVGVAARRGAIIGRL